MTISLLDSDLVTDSGPVTKRVRHAGPVASKPRAVADQHLVQFYKREETLVPSVCSFIGAGLQAGEGAVIIATADHRAAVVAQLQDDGFDTVALQEKGELVLLDAAGILSNLLCEDSPDEARFNQVVGPIIRKAACNRTGVRAFGEMVALLCAAGNPAAAIRLEELWNDLAARERLSLLCAYPVAAFASAAATEAFQQVCHCHARVLPMFESEQTADERHRAIAFLEQKAMAFEAEVRRRQRAEATLEAELADAKLLQSVSAELISEKDVGTIYEKLVDAAVSIMHSDFASMQMFYSERGSRGALRLLASRGFSLEAQRCWEWVSDETASSCGEVLRSGKRVVAKDVEQCEFLIRLGGLSAYLGAGIRAMQSTPLISRAGKLVGMISTHWRRPHEPSERDLRLFDLLVRQAADLLERTQAEERLRQSEERYRDLFDSIDQGFSTIEVLFDDTGKAVDYRFLLVNPAFERQTGLVRPAGRRMREIAPPHEAEWFETYGRIALTGEAQRFEREVKELGRHYEVYAWRIGEPAERKVGVLFNDITDRRRAAESEGRLAAIVEHSSDAILSIDLGAKILSWNQGAERLYGYSRAEAIGQHVSILIPENRENEEPQILARIERSETVQHYETVRRRKDGTLVDVSLTVSPLKDSSGRVVGASKVARDITERVRAREMLEHTVTERTKQLRETVSELEAFSYSIAHDMRAPLRAMNGYARFLEADFGEKLPETGKNFLRRISMGASRLDRLITDVLNYSKIARGEMPLEKVDIEKLTQDIVDTYPSLRESGATVLVEGPIPPVLGNTAALTQCVSNLLSNAVKFIAPGTKAQVRIRGEIRGNQVRYSIQDNGIGIDEEGRRRIFRLFQRINLSTEFDGTGIGLTIVRKAVKRMNGQVGVDSTPGTGSTFWIELPFAE